MKQEDGTQYEKKLLLISAILPLGLQAQVDEQKKWFVGTHYSFQEISSLQDREPEAFGVMGGYRISKYFSVEARFNVGSSGYSSPLFVSDEQREYKEEIETQAFLLLKASYPIFDSINVYALAGMSQSKYEITTLRFSADLEGVTTVIYPHKIDVTENGFTYGIGIDYQINDSFSLFVDHQVLPDLEVVSGSAEDWSSTNIGVTYSF